MNAVASGFPLNEAIPIVAEQRELSGAFVPDRNDTEGLSFLRFTRKA